MKMNRLLTVVIACIIGLTSCSVTRNRAYAPSVTQLNLQMSDFEYLGETEISIEYRRYLGVFTRIDAVNGLPYDGQEINSVELNAGYLDGVIPFRFSGKLDRASIKLLEDFPDANYYVVVRQSRHTTRWFLGSDITVKAVVKAYKLK